jgi:hypothetical protein
MRPTSPPRLSFEVDDDEHTPIHPMESCKPNVVKRWQYALGAATLILVCGYVIVLRIAATSFPDEHHHGRRLLDIPRIIETQASPLPPPTYPPFVLTHPRLSPSLHSLLLSLTLSLSLS